MARGFALGFAAAIAMLIVACLVLVTNGALPAGQDSKAGSLEKWAAKTSLRATMRREAQGLRSPLPPSDENLTAGATLYVSHCQVCHGGPDAGASSIAKGLTPPAPQLAKHGVEDDPEGVIYWKIHHGIRFTGMPGFGAALSTNAMWQIALFAKHMDSLPPAARGVWAAGKLAP